MKKLKKYEVLLDTGKDIKRVYLPATSKKDVDSELEGQGDIVRVKEIADVLPSAAKVRDDLKKVGYGEAECELVYKTLLRCLEGTDG